MRNKAEITAIVAKKHTKKMIESSGWDDLRSVINSQTKAQKKKLITLLIKGRVERAGSFLRNILIADAKERAMAKAQAQMENNSLNLAEIDDLL